MRDECEAAGRPSIMGIRHVPSSSSSCLHGAGRRRSKETNERAFRVWSDVASLEGTSKDPMA